MVASLYTVLIWCHHLTSSNQWAVRRNVKFSLPIQGCLELFLFLHINGSLRKWLLHQSGFLSNCDKQSTHFPPHWTMLLLLLSHFSRVRLCVTPWTAAHQAPLSLGFSRQEHWSGLPFPSPMHESEKWKWSRPVVSDSQRSHGLQPTRLLHPWDFPGKSTGVGCHNELW